MSILKYSYKTNIQFSEKVHTHNFLLRILPFENQAQTLLYSKYSILPQVEVGINTDYFGNKIITGYLDSPHDFFEFSSEGLVRTSAYVLQEPLNRLFIYTSKLTKPVQSILSIQRTLNFEKSIPIHDKVKIISEAIRFVLEYQPDTTNIQTTADEALKIGKGVCQDFAHIMISLCRLNEIPARYVAGFIGGEGYTHAWVEYYDNGYWHGFDPTHHFKIEHGYIKIAQGRDYADCPMDKGVFIGIAQQKLDVNLKVEQEQEQQ